MKLIEFALLLFYTMLVGVVFVLAYYGFIFLYCGGKEVYNNDLNKILLFINGSIIGYLSYLQLDYLTKRGNKK